MMLLNSLREFIDYDVLGWIIIGNIIIYMLKFLFVFIKMMYHLLRIND